MRALAEAGQVFDLIFIDADKTGYRDYYRLVLDGGLLAPNGLLCIDNTLMQGQPYMPEPPTTNGRAIRDFNRMVCSAYRALLELLGIPYLGNRPLQMAIAADKAKTKAIASAAGIRAPLSELLRKGDTPTLNPPLVVKPNDADNSDGLSLVTAREDIPAALARAFDHADAVLVEEYVALGREVRCGIVVHDDEMICLPLEEYAVDPVTRPIRRRSDKLRRDAGDALALAAKDATQSWIVPADDPIVPAVWAAGRHCHVALGCRHYSLFDFRIDPQGDPWLLEAGLYCSFSPLSVLVTMMTASGVSLQQFFRTSIEAALRA